MDNLIFNSPSFKKGVNITVRRGTKWSGFLGMIDVCQSGTNKLIRLANVLRSQSFVFKDLQDSDLVNEHAENCRTYKELLQVMKQTYDNFDEREIVTILTFTITY